MDPSPALRASGSGFMPRLAEPPRRVPFGLRARLLFGGLGVFAWIWLGFGTVLSGGFLKHADLSSWLLFRGALATVEGASLGCEDTGSSEGGAKGSRGTPIYANRYGYTVDGVERTGVSYSLGACIPEGHAVMVQHPPGRPEVSRIAGMRRATFGPAVLFVAIFPLVGVGLVALSLVMGRRQLRLLERGRLALGTLVSVEGTNTSVNKRQVMKLKFDMTTDRGTRHEVFVRSHVPEAAQDDPKERLLYDPDRPEEVVAWDLLSPAPRLDPSGQLEGPGALGALGVLLPPLFALAAAAAALRFF